ncbi:hypothetical protein K8T06_16640, partial [bacterium]|nr:hypothetical protein [bacterium]
LVLQIIKLPAESGIDTLLMEKFCIDTDVVAIPDNEGAAPGLDALVRASNWIRTGYRIVLYLNCRDRNRIDIASRYNGAVHLGVSYIIIETGFHALQGPIPEAKSVYDLDPIQCAYFLNQLQKKTTASPENLPCIGMRTSVQELDDFEIGRMSRICLAQPDFLIIHSKRRLDHVSHWIKHCQKVPGFAKFSLIWEKADDIQESFDDVVEVPDGVHGLLLKY